MNEVRRSPAPWFSGMCPERLQGTFQDNAVGHVLVPHRLLGDPMPHLFVTAVQFFQFLDTFQSQSPASSQPLPLPLSRHTNF